MHVSWNSSPVVSQGAARKNERTIWVPESDGETFLQPRGKDVGPCRIDKPLIDVIEAGGEIDKVKWELSYGVLKFDRTGAVEFWVAGFKRNTD